MLKYSIGAAIGGLLLMAAPVSAAPPVPGQLGVKSPVEAVHSRHYRHRHSGYYGHRRHGPRYYGYRSYPRYYGGSPYGYSGYSGYYGPRAGVSVGPLGFYW